MNIQRSIKNVEGDLTISGDVIVADKDHGLVLKDQADVEKRITAITEEGVTTLAIKDA